MPVPSPQVASPVVAPDGLGDRTQDRVARAGTHSVAVSVVVITRNRRPELLTTLERLQALQEAGEADDVVVVDNASTDGSAAAVTRHFPGVRVLEQAHNLGAVGRNVGAAASGAAVVAFADDDSWWAPGALRTAAQLFHDHPRLGLLHGRLVVEPSQRIDPVSVHMAQGPRASDLPGPSILGHVGCGTIVRREAFEEVGGYSALLGFGAEEGLLSLDLAAAGWAQCYVEALVAHHAPSAVRESQHARRARCRRNDTLTAVLRLPAPYAAREAARLLRHAVTDAAVRREVPPFLRRLPAALLRREPVPPEVWDRWLASRMVPAS